MEEVKQIPLKTLHENLGAKMIPFAGFNMPVRYSSDLEEHMTVREGVGIFDVSHMGEFMLEGPKALDLIQKVSANDASKLEIGKAQYSYLPNETGGVVDDLLVYKRGEESYMLVVNASNIEKDWQHIQKYNTENVAMQNVSDAYCLFAVQGPKAIEALQELTTHNLSEVPYYSFIEGEMAGIDDVIISATGYTGAGGFELYVKNERAEELWNKVMEAGEKFGIKPIGLGARDTLRLEMGYCLYGNDITDETSPLAAGLGWVTKFTKEFVNAAKLKEDKEQGTAQKLVGIEMIEKGIPRAHYNLLNEAGDKIGEISSGTMSPSLKIGVALAYVNTAYAKKETEVWVEVRNRKLKAKVVRPPFLKSGV
ncbi:glycine cleavage system aminomethyltransferase GcvT [Marinilongibacter aquaticus]|uniref:glycine cleavage system aminomethyltransferase GcvT n=1 Tax=Marinilongibacter aquaticus TaxID=2975157 RepID=UPI0021BDD23B|nr:glycine cleavage system aminomethyltransferase GcvT [Marinilongibacter aquaticus]UBM57583.1 glycine cleavage system aminomethyltransferase GcvT [Marinilongibacter aquaticus]